MEGDRGKGKGGKGGGAKGGAKAPYRSYKNTKAKLFDSTPAGRANRPKSAPPAEWVKNHVAVSSWVSYDTSDKEGESYSYGPLARWPERVRDEVLRDREWSPLEEDHHAQNKNAQRYAYGSTAREGPAWRVWDEISVHEAAQIEALMVQDPNFLRGTVVEAGLDGRWAKEPQGWKERAAARANMPRRTPEQVIRLSYTASTPTLLEEHRSNADVITTIWQ